MLRLKTDADVAELADALDLGSSTERCEGSSPFIRILIEIQNISADCLSVSCILSQVLH